MRDILSVKNTQKIFWVQSLWNIPKTYTGRIPNIRPWIISRANTIEFDPRLNKIRLFQTKITPNTIQACLELKYKNYNDLRITKKTLYSDMAKLLKTKLHLKNHHFVLQPLKIIRYYVSSI